MIDKEQFKNEPRSYAYDLADMGIISWETLATACLKFLSNDEVRQMLEANCLEPSESEDE